jgi:6-phosphogluconolactonase
MDIMPVENTSEAASAAAELIAEHARRAIEARGSFHLGLSGGRGPGPLFAALAELDLDWPLVHLYQVDERVAPAGHDDRNLELIRDGFHPVLDRLGGLHAMPVEDDDLDAAAVRYGRLLRRTVGEGAGLDLVHLGIGPDGHTASLVPDDPVLDVDDQPVAVTKEYQGRRRMTLTFAALDAARHRLWHVTDPDKHEAVARLVQGDPSIPAGRVRAGDTTAVITREVLTAAGIDV